MYSQNMPPKLLERLRSCEITLEQALAELVDPRGMVNLAQLDAATAIQFFRDIPDRSSLPPLIPFFQWRHRYYLGSPVILSQDAIQQIQQQLRDRTLEVQIIPIAAKSYHDWKQQQLPKPQPALEAARPASSKPPSKLPKALPTEPEGQIRWLKDIIISASEKRASDIHLETFPEGLKVKFRIDGILHHILTLKPEVSRRLISALKVMCDMDIAESRSPQDGRLAEKYAFNDQVQGLDLRVSVIPVTSAKRGEPAEKAVLRLLRQQKTFPAITQLGFSESARRDYERMLHQPQGMIIITGPTGSGKSNTLCASLQSINHEGVNICTLEDPIEQVLQDINQTQVHEEAGMTFAAGLRAILRQDPDIIMVGEIRDRETADIAVRASLTGHLVLTTLHTNDAIRTIPRLRDIGLDAGLISDALLGVVAQRLVRQVCPHCATPYQPTDEELHLLSLRRDQVKSQNWLKGQGCEHCMNSGYLGRQAIVEVLVVDDAVRQILYEGTVTQLAEHLRQIDYCSFRKAAIEKVTLGVTTVEEVRRSLPYTTLYHS